MRRPCRRTAKLDKLTIKVDRPQLTPEDIKSLQQAEAAAGDAKAPAKGPSAPN